MTPMQKLQNNFNILQELLKENCYNIKTQDTINEVAKVIANCATVRTITFPSKKLKLKS